MTEPSEAVQVSSARARWRADLLSYHAAELNRIVGSQESPTAKGILDEATEKEAQASIHLDHAEAGERMSIAKIDAEADPTDPDKIAARDAAVAAMQELRAYWRGIGEFYGTRRAVMTVDHFPEPTDEEVLASHGGAN